MRVLDIMSKEVETVQSTATLLEAAGKMRERNVGALPVYVGGVLAGFVTDRDITVRAIARGLDASSCKVEDVMSWNAEWCWDDADLEDALRVMAAKKVRRLAVLDAAGALAGILSVDDIAARAHDSAIVEKVVEATAPRTKRAGGGFRPDYFEERSSR